MLLLSRKMYIILLKGVNHLGHIVTTLIVLVATVSYAMTAFWIGVNGYTTIETIERLPLLFSPASFVYIMTFVICAGLIYFIWQSFKDRQTPYALTGFQGVLLILASFLQISFFYSWHYENYLPAVIMLVLQLLSLFILHLTYPLERASMVKRIPIALWFGWHLFFLFVVTSYLVVYSGWSGFGLSNALWAVIMLTICTAIALHVRYHHHDRITPVIVIWGFSGIVVANGLNELFVSAAALFLIGVLVAGILYMKKRKKAA